MLLRSPLLKEITGMHYLPLTLTDSGNQDLSAICNLSTHNFRDHSDFCSVVSGDTLGPGSASVFETIADATVAQYFESFSVDLEKLDFPQAMLVEFVNYHADWLEPNGFRNLFLINSNGWWIVNIQRRFDGQIFKRLHRFDDPEILGSIRRHRIIILN